MAKKWGLLPLTLWALLLNAQSNFQNGILDDRHESVVSNELFKTHDYYFKQDNVYNSICTWKGNTYFVFLNLDRRPMVGKVDSKGEVTVLPLDQNESDPYRAVDDAHHLFGIGVDKYGYLHITGDMHNYKFGNTNNDLGYPSRYTQENNHIMYWKSSSPEDISEFEFIGGNADKVIPGYGFSYVTMYTDMNGMLYARFRHKVGPWGHYDGEMGFGLAKYDADNEKWSAIGEIPEASYFSAAQEPFNRAVFWVNTGTVNGWYQGFLSDFEIDFNNRLHVVANMITEENADPRYTLYACSDDEGETFERADGTPVELPMNLFEGHMPDTTMWGGKYWTTPAVTFDKEGTPIVFSYDRPRRKQYMAYYDTATKKWSDRRESLSGFDRPNHTVDANGIVTFVNDGLPSVVVRSLGIEPQSWNTPTQSPNMSDWDDRFRGHDKRSVIESNSIKVFANPNSNDTLRIVQIKGMPKKYDPIPSSLSVAKLLESVGETGMVKDVFNLQSNGYGLTGGKVHGQYVNRAVVGDFEVTCRVIQMDYHCDSTFAGIMLTHGADGSQFFSEVITWDGIETWLNGTKNYDGPYNQPSEWLRLNRTDNKVTAYRSDNNKNWSVVDEVEIDLPDTVFVGLISGSGNVNIGHARIDHLKISSTGIVQDTTYIPVIPDTIIVPVDPDTIIVPVNPSNAAPVIHVNVKNELYKGMVYELDASESYDPDNDAISFQWNIPKDIAVSESNTAIIKVLPADEAQNKNYTIQLSVSDGKEVSHTAVILSVVDFNPGAYKLPIKSVESSGYQEGHYPEYIFDGNEETRWSAEGDGEWIQFELEKEATISHFGVNFTSANVRKAFFDIYASIDNTNWDLIFENTESSGFAAEPHNFPMSNTKSDKVYKHVKLVGHMNTENAWNSYNEITIYGTESVDITSTNSSEFDITELYPNPATEIVYVNLPKEGALRIASLSGTILHEQMGRTGENRINYVFQSGLYILQVLDKSDVAYSKKLVVK